MYPHQECSPSTSRDTAAAEYYRFERRQFVQRHTRARLRVLEVRNGRSSLIFDS